MADIQAKRDKINLEKALKSTMRYIQGVKGPGIGKFSEITSHIFICDWENAIDIQMIRENRINAIICIDKRTKASGVTKSYKKRKIQEMNFAPEAKLLAKFEPTYNFIHHFVGLDKKVLVHCDEGINASVAIVLYYLLKRYYLTNFKKNKRVTKELVDRGLYFLPRIVQFVKETRQCIEPAMGYIDQLLWAEYQMKKHFEKILEEEAALYRETHPPENPDDADDENDPDFFPNKKEESIDHYIDKIFEEEQTKSGAEKKKKKKKSEPEKFVEADSDSDIEIMKPDKKVTFEKSKTKKDKAKKDKNKKEVGSKRKADNQEPSRLDKLEDIKSIEHSDDEPAEPENVKKKKQSQDSDSESASDSEASSISD